MQSFRASKTDEGKRADVFISEKLPDFSRASLRPLFKRGFVRIKSLPVKPGHKLKENEQVLLDNRMLSSQPPSASFPIIYEDNDVIVINKPAGTLTHSKGAINSEATIASFLKDKITDGNLAGNRAGIVHRLDRATSGVIIGAKNAAALKYLQRQFSNRKVGKTYLALVHGIPAIKSAAIDVPIERNPKKPQTFRVGSGGKTAQTAYSILKTFRLAKKTYSLLELRPTTGRTHQLRVHLAYIGHPIAGDRVYGPNDDQKMLLHAQSLEITLPDGAKRKFEAPMPQDFKNFTS